MVTHHSTNLLLHSNIHYYFAVDIHPQFRNSGYSLCGGVGYRAYVDGVKSSKPH